MALRETAAVGALMAALLGTGCEGTASTPPGQAPVTDSGAGVSDGGAPPSDLGDAVSAGRALTAWADLQREFQVPGHPLLYPNQPGGSIAPIWPMGQVVAAAEDMAVLLGDAGVAVRALDGLPGYEEGQAYRPDWSGPSDQARYWDDNGWMGLDLLQAYATLELPNTLTEAKRLFPFMLSGVSPSGGLYWAERATTPTLNTCTQGAALGYGLRLYLATRDSAYLDFAKNIDAFLNGPTSVLHAPNGMYYDHLTPSNGQVDMTLWSYNQGAPVGADVLFFRITQDGSYLARAKATAQAALDYYGQQDRLWKQAPVFNAIFFRNLLALDAVAPDPRYRAAIAAYLDRAWTQARDPTTGRFMLGGVGTYGQPAGNLIDQAAFIQLYALMGWPRSKLPLVH